MKTLPHAQRFFSSTRGEITKILRNGAATVADMAERLNLTRNAVRAHLATLERDGLVRQVGEQAGTRKPHLTYGLTEEADELFPSAYAPVLNALLEKLTATMGEEESRRFLCELGRQMAGGTHDANSSFEANVATALEVLKELGGNVHVEREQGKSFISSTGCPLAEVVNNHDAVCEMMAAFLTAAIGTPVSQCCRHEGRHRCRFEIADPCGGSGNKS